ncbi:OmpA family protein [Flavobacteriaceae bacterium F89]|uniref:OmpA family protein n=1 Tax=Cerina litoralis TaxID=2874477 RepID=A0AAE3ES35_9FLAO|nr:OmpA family protein [Cerina litoralis]MCG2459139.1 OmpA family protein [Cerina litoralis]
MKKLLIALVFLFSLPQYAQVSQGKDTELDSKENISIDDVTYDMLVESTKIGKPVFRKSSKRDRLIAKADEYFDKMWYAEAADLYEMALSNEPEDQSMELLEKAGDANYFNTNMERAYYWYDLLYKNYKKEVSTDNLFKYANSLKGIGKYGRAKRFMRIYNKRYQNEHTLKVVEVKGEEMKRKEAILDNILSEESNYEIMDLAINSEYSDFSPMFYQDDKVVFSSAMDSSFLTTRRYKWNNQPYLDLYVAKINEESQELKDAMKFSKKINTKYHEASVTFSSDNKTMYFTRNNYIKKLGRDKNGVNNLKIYKSVKVDGDWTEAVELPFNSASYSTGHPALSSDGKKLYFVSDMPGSIGKTDIFVVDVLPDGTYSAPKNLGPEINTEQREMFPFVKDNKIYFSSDGHTGLGGLDIYEATYDEEGFNNVKNLGVPVNSNKDDFSYIVNEKNQTGYFASNRVGGKGDDDIYSFKRLVIEEVPANKNAIAGVVTERVSGEVIPQALVTLLDENNIKLKEMLTNDDGSFVFEDLEGNTKYAIKTARKDYFEQDQMVTTKENEKVDIEVPMKKLKELIVVEDGVKKLKTDVIYFNFDKSQIRDDAGKELDKVVEVMNEYPDMVIKIESHTDSRGKASYNKYLSDKRAKSTRDYLISNGIDSHRIESAIGYGEEHLINGCADGVSCSREKHELNRRSEIIIVKM